MATPNLKGYSLSDLMHMRDLLSRAYKGVQAMWYDQDVADKTKASIHYHKVVRSMGRLEDEINQRTADFINECNP